jgi:hypothetical protein
LFLDLVFIETRTGVWRNSRLRSKRQACTQGGANVGVMIARGNLAVDCGWRADSDSTEAASTTGHLLDFALQKLRGNLRLIPATDAVAA